MEFAKSLKRYGYRVSIKDGLDKKAKVSGFDVVVHFGFPHLFRIDKTAVNIGRVMLESDSVPRLWADIMNRMDEVWVASKFNLKTFAKGGVNKKRIFVVPDMAGRDFKPPERKIARNGPFRFLSVFLDLSLRKGWDIMLEEFVFTFGGREDVEWVVQCSASSARKLRGILKSLEKGAPVGNIKVRGKRPSTPQMRKLYHSADCYLLPTRGEGFGRPYLEAVSSGLPVIATGFGGQLDFLNRRNSRLLKYKLKKIPAPEALDCYFMAGDRWAEPSGSDLSLAMKEALKHPKFEPVNLEPFGEESVMKTVGERFLKVRKRKIAEKLFKPQIVVYDNKWEESFPTPVEFKRNMRKRGASVAIAGTGRNAEQLACFLENSGFKVMFFIGREAGSFTGKKVYAVDNLRQIPKVDIGIISTFPASFAEWKLLIGRHFEFVVPVIFYRQ